jgi:hypothetical protein
LLKAAAATEACQFAYENNSAAAAAAFAFAVAPHTATCCMRAKPQATGYADSNPPFALHVVLKSSTLCTCRLAFVVNTQMYLLLL